MEPTFHSFAFRVWDINRTQKNPSSYIGENILNKVYITDIVPKFLMRYSSNLNFLGKIVVPLKSQNVILDAVWQNENVIFWNDSYFFTNYAQMWMASSSSTDIQG